MNDRSDNRQNDQNVDEASADMKGEEPERPKNEQDNRNREKHG